MARPIEKKDYQDSDERVATFRISHGKLTAFQDVCAAKGTSVSQALIGFIDTVISGGDIPEKGSLVSLPENMVTKEAFDSAIAPLNLQIKRLQGLIFNAPIDLGIENERPFFTLDERVKYLEIELGELKKGQRDRVTAIAELRNEFANKLGDFRSEVADTAITDGTMRSAIADLLTKTEFESAKDDIWAELTRLDSSVAMVGNYYEFTGNEEFFNQQENAAIAVDDGQNESQVADKEAQSKISAIQGNLLESSETGDLKVSDDKDEKGGFSCYSDLESLTTRELRPMATQAKIKGSRTMSKPQLIEALRAKAEKTKLSAQ